MKRQVDRRGVIAAGKREESRSSKLKEICPFSRPGGALLSKRTEEINDPVHKRGECDGERLYEQEHGNAIQG
jgi:hypothetical protein